MLGVSGFYWVVHGREGVGVLGLTSSFDSTTDGSLGTNSVALKLDFDTRLLESQLKYVCRECDKGLFVSMADMVCCPDLLAVCPLQVQRDGDPTLTSLDPNWLETRARLVRPWPIYILGCDDSHTILS